MRVLVTRPQPDADRTAKLLISMGHEPVIAPVSEIVAVAGEWPAGPFDGVLLTSQNGLRHGVARLPGEIARLPLFAVGQRTALAAREAGFGEVLEGKGTGEGMAGLIRRRMPGRARLLYLAGEPRKPGLERELAACGFTVEALVVYRAVPVRNLPEPAVEMLKSGKIDSVLHYSREGAARFVALARVADLAPEALRLRHICLSGDVAMPLADAPNICIAAEPMESALLKLLDDCRSGNYI